MEAIERFVNVPGQSVSFGWAGGVLICIICISVEVSNPKLVVILGCFGLSSNIVGLFLFHGTSFSVCGLSQ